MSLPGPYLPITRAATRQVLRQRHERTGAYERALGTPNPPAPRRGPTTVASMAVATGAVERDSGWNWLLALWVLPGVVMALLWVAGVLVPYYVNDLHQFPLQDVAGGYHDPKDLWPYDSGGPAWALVRLGAFFAVMLGGVVAAMSALAGSVVLVASRRSAGAGQRALIATATAVAAAFAVVWFSPFGQAMRAWTLD